MRVKSWILIGGLMAQLIVEPAVAKKLSDAATAVAYNTLQRLAEQGDVDAQFELGEKCVFLRLYTSTHGYLCTEQDGIKWMHKAAEKRHIKAMLSLGEYYFLGLGVPEDYALAHMWVNLATVDGGFEALKSRRDLEEFLSQGQIAEGQRLAREWSAAHPQ